MIYSFLHLHAASLHFGIYINLLHKSLFSVSSFWSVNIRFWLITKVLGVNIGYSESFSTYVEDRLFKVFSEWINTSSSSLHDNKAFPTVFQRAFLTRLTIRSNCPPHHGTLLKLNFYSTLLKLKKWFSSSDLFSFFHAFAWRNERLRVIRINLLWMLLSILLPFDLGLALDEWLY